MANANTERFQYLTAQAMCGRCVVQLTCLVDAIQGPPTYGGVRGGEPSSRIAELRRQNQRGQTSVEELALSAIEEQQTRIKVSNSPVLRSGMFPDMPVQSEE